MKHRTYEASYVILMMHHASYGDSRMDQMMLMDMDGEEEMMITYDCQQLLTSEPMLLCE